MNSQFQVPAQVQVLLSEITTTSVCLLTKTSSCKKTTPRQLTWTLEQLWEVQDLVVLLEVEAEDMEQTKAIAQPTVIWVLKIFSQQLKWPTTAATWVQARFSALNTLVPIPHMLL